MSESPEQGNLLVNSSFDGARIMDLNFLSLGLLRDFLGAATCFSETVSKSAGARARDGGDWARGRDSYVRKDIFVDWSMMSQSNLS